MEYDFVAIGDTATDAFIHLDSKSAHLDIDHDVRELCMRFGDKIFYDEVYVIPAVGNSANAANAAARLGLRTALVSNIGDDIYGKDTLEVFKFEDVATDFVKVNEGKKTNYHYVLWYEDDRTILIKHEKYDYALPDIGSPKWIYLSSLGENSLEFHKELVRYLGAHPGVKLAFQPGTYQMKFGKDALKEIYQRTEIFFVNKDEAKRILEIEEDDDKKLLEKLHSLGPKIVVITDGPAGARAFDGTTAWYMPSYPDPKPPLQRTGAGDAFSSTVTAALCMGMSIEEALRWGPVNSMSVVQKIGARAGLLKRLELEAYLKNAPADYKPRVL